MMPMCKFIAVFVNKNSLIISLPGHPSDNIGKHRNAIKIDLIIWLKAAIFLKQNKI